ncbi:DUF1501 domain-containing protein [Roseateles koreensis]|uniref:DUF1501 domain-containing protein n=1 Tax=Roseateles koreensis TaxID=2987526 RepID=A0ABT5KVT1_9BURK|nr:DUF1501 domain-containing protein [Roseateles koreensis]MDC8785902.1 DUF1501 domain-containing protein [Roseateles koreensis]
MRRRELLATTLSLPLAMGTTRLAAAGPQTSKLLVVFLRGGYDAASLLVPISSNFYYEARKDIAIAKPSSNSNSSTGVDAGAALPLTADWGLHPALRESLYPLYQQGELAFVPFAGTDDLSRSHFETQDSIELGQPTSGHKNYASGFLNRLAAVVSGSTPMAFTEQLPVILRGGEKVANTALKSLAKPAIDARQSDLIATMYRGTPLASTVQEGFSVRQELMRDLAGEMEAANRNAITAKGFALKARRIAKVMRGDFNLGFVDVGGWDTHVSQGAATGYLANRFDELGQGLAAFSQEMGSRWKDTTVVVISEFGRTFRQNGNRGTDHGHGTVFWVLGGSVKGGRIAGEQVTVSRNTLFQDRDFPVLNDYRAVLGGLFQRQYGLSTAQLAQVFPGAVVNDVGLI